MSRLSAIAGSATFFVLAPVTVAGIVPWWLTHWKPEIAWMPVQAAGCVLFAGGALVLIECFARFALQGLGTPAPVLPTRRLVITGAYRYVRNPMYVAVVAIIAGQALVFGSVRLLAYSVLVWLLFHAFIVRYEEPTLLAAYGPEYQRFCAAVPRWIPRLTRQEW
jgi:protein-S-isoprenylcysteine O-methyltransferase Ste14